MAATQLDIERWFDEGIEYNYTHMIIVCDTFDWSDWPLYVSSHEDAKTVADENDMVNMQRIMEVYNLSMDKDAQIRQRRACNY